MPESLFTRRLKLGTFLGIGLYVHWTFSLVIVYVALNTLETGLFGVAFAIAELIGVFVCVTLHEYGHAMAARQFGIGTADITLLPIGGVARLQRMPRIPWQELIVAVAGPAVNLVLVAVLAVAFLGLVEPSSLRALVGYSASLVSDRPIDEEMTATLNQLFMAPSLFGFGVLLMIVNVMLVVFNMIPAFPMDGGRVFRSLLAMTMDYRRATSIASKVGLVCAALMAIAALSAVPPRPMVVLIAAFIGYAGLAEARHVAVTESVRGQKVSQVMIHSDRALSLDTPLSELARQWQRTSQASLPVVSITGTVIGMLHVHEVAAAIAAEQDPITTAGQLINHEKSVDVVRADDELEEVLLRIGKHRQVPVVDSDGRLIGMLDLDTMLARADLPSTENDSSDRSLPRFDASS